ncbi:MAG: DMT family transporter [Magnetococcales bacterium]|nr:DMT family transporter [Magnetococcales bacterium]
MKVPEIMWQSRWLALPDLFRGGVWMLLYAATFAAMGAMVRLLGVELPTIQIIFFRGLLGLLWLLPYLLWNRGADMVTGNFRLHLWRGLASMITMSTTFFAYANLPLADVVALSFTTPLYLMFFAVWILKERLSRAHLLAALVGFGGILLMVRPGLAFDPMILVAIVSPLLIALVQLLIKHMTRSEGIVTIVFWFSVSITLFSAPFAAYAWQPVPDTLWPLLLAMGGMATLVQITISRAYLLADAVAVTPFDYSRLLFAGILGFFLFDEHPDAYGLAGSAAILAANFFLMRLAWKAKASLPANSPAPRRQDP